MMAHLSKASNMVMDYNFLTMETITKESIRWVDSMARVDTDGKMEHPMMGASLMVKDKALEDGNPAKLSTIYILGSTRVIRNQEKGNTPGAMVRCMKDTS